MQENSEYIEDGQIFHGHIPYIMGTCLDVLTVGVSEDRLRPLWVSVCELVSRLDKMLNRFDYESEVYALNMTDASFTKPMSDMMKDISGIAAEYKKRTYGLFDIIDEDGRMDFGGFAKGYFLRLCEKLLREAGVDCAFVDFGNSSILGIGHHPYGDCWKVGVVNPYGNETLKEVCLKDMSMSTSGNTPVYSGHIRHPLTGYVCSDHKIATAIAADPLDAEVLSTVLMIAGPEEIGEVKKNFPDAETEVIIL